MRLPPEKPALEFELIMFRIISCRFLCSYIFVLCGCRLFLRCVSSTGALVSIPRPRTQGASLSISRAQNFILVWLRRAHVLAWGVAKNNSLRLALGFLPRPRFAPRETLPRRGVRAGGVGENANSRQNTARGLHVHFHKTQAPRSLEPGGG